MKVLQTLPQNDLNAVPAAAKAAEDAGFHMVCTMENRHDPFLALGVSAVATEKIMLGTAIAIAFPRSPMVVANACWDLQVASVAGLCWALDRKYAHTTRNDLLVPWSPPVPRLREYVNALRAIWSCWETGEKLDFRGEHYTFTLMILESLFPRRLVRRRCRSPSRQSAIIRSGFQGRRVTACAFIHSVRGRIWKTW